ncbi:hypothetical protein GALL_260220 [mine drainage metagenome]|uniref:Uncharacterized protein n=1 Tax=mine drainage metagenome TaxID=410659 RepID=A0A1J5R7Q2_9ZZZZ
MDGCQRAEPTTEATGAFRRCAVSAGSTRARRVRSLRHRRSTLSDRPAGAGVRPSTSSDAFPLLNPRAPARHSSRGVGTPVDQPGFAGRHRGTGHRTRPRWAVSVLDASHSRHFHNRHRSVLQHTTAFSFPPPTAETRQSSSRSRTGAGARRTRRPTASRARSRSRSPPRCRLPTSMSNGVPTSTFVHDTATGGPSPSRRPRRILHAASRTPSVTGHQSRANAPRLGVENTAREPDTRGTRTTRSARTRRQSAADTGPGRYPRGRPSTPGL